MALAFVNIGSNIGSRKQLILGAVEGINREFGICCLSSFIESEPWGFNSENRFLNLGVSFHTELNPDQLLAVLQNIERTISTLAHRDSDGNYQDREIDIDIMAIDDIVFDSDRLVIPHPHLMDREFFLKPMFELSPGWRHPLIKS